MSAERRGGAERRLRAICRFRLAEADMRQAAAAAEFLAARGAKLDPDVERALETGLVVSYARPFSRSSFGAIPPRLATPSDAEGESLHRSLIAHRDDLSAHNEANGLRTLEDLEAFVAFGAGRVLEGWRSLDREQLPLVLSLCRAQEARFRQHADRLEAAVAPMPRTPAP